MTPRLIDESADIGSGNGLAPSGNKRIPEPMLDKFYDAIWGYKELNQMWVYYPDLVNFIKKWITNHIS